MSARRVAELIAAALAYIALGWPVFILSSSKAPLALCDRCKAEHRTAELMESCRCLCCHGFYAATLDEDRARQMIRQHPGGLLAVRTGLPSMTVVLDFDGASGIGTMRRLVAAGQLPRTRLQRSGRRDGGYHVVYRHPGGRIKGGAGKAGPGADIKSDGGYFIVEPSRHPVSGQPYRWLSDDPLTPLPQYWADRLREIPHPVPEPGSWRAPVTRAGSYGAAALRDEARKVAETMSCRNHALNTASFRLGQIAAAGMLGEAEIVTALMDAAAACGLVAEDGPRACEATIRSGLRAGLAQPRVRVSA